MVTELFKIETHLHTKTSSGCGHLSATEILEGYHAAGYSGLCVTDHYLRYYFDKMGIPNLPPSRRLERFLLGYQELCDAADAYGIRIYKGAELRFDENENDYLFYGWPDQLLSDPDAIFTTGLKEFYPISREVGAVLIQAHPFRAPSVISDFSCLDGIEIYNGHPRHNSNNDLAENVVRENPCLIGTSDSDCHRTPDIARGGIVVKKLPQDETELADILRSKAFTCLKSI